MSYLRENKISLRGGSKNHLNMLVQEKNDGESMDDIDDIEEEPAVGESDKEFED